MTTLNNSFATSALVVAAALPLVCQAATPPVDPVGRPAVISCGKSAQGLIITAAHADKIIFMLTGPLHATNPVDQLALDKIPRNTELDIKVIDNPKTVADLKGKVLTFLGAVDNVDFRQFIKIISVEYAMVCPNTTSGL
jgi:hypothetical protein